MGQVIFLFGSPQALQAPTRRLACEVSQLYVGLAAARHDE
eukprot:CAMPEP_0195075178 /NCGR_PEP_ID=MMETSP0448-20130528/18110_1 /TAXON_ID=66468 /ORGANISM="Heterocapsa triquestra, Strain CCMP 448" /LENGTH=39 /DNA_ID= /DNA_START= /DNA_END= /DNA_ORIENTATION=